MLVCVGGQKNVRLRIFPYNIIEYSPISSAYNSAFVDTNNFKLSTETHCVVL